MANSKRRKTIGAIVFLAGYAAVYAGYLLTFSNLGRFVPAWLIPIATVVEILGLVAMVAGLAMVLLPIKGGKTPQ